MFLLKNLFITANDIDKNIAKFEENKPTDLFCFNVTEDMDSMYFLSLEQISLETNDVASIYKKLESKPWINEVVGFGFYSREEVSKIEAYKGFSELYTANPEGNLGVITKDEQGYTIHMDFVINKYDAKKLFSGSSYDPEVLARIISEIQQAPIIIRSNLKSDKFEITRKNGNSVELRFKQKMCGLDVLFLQQKIADMDTNSGVTMEISSIKKYEPSSKSNASNSNTFFQPEPMSMELARKPLKEEILGMEVDGLRRHRGEGLGGGQDEREQTLHEHFGEVVSMESEVTSSDSDSDEEYEIPRFMK